MPLLSFQGTFLSILYNNLVCRNISSFHRAYIKQLHWLNLVNWGSISEVVVLINLMLLCNKILEAGYFMD